MYYKVCRPQYFFIRSALLRSKIAYDLILIFSDRVIQEAYNLQAINLASTQNCCGIKVQVYGEKFIFVQKNLSKIFRGRVNEGQDQILLKATMSTDCTQSSKPTICSSRSSVETLKIRIRNCRKYSAKGTRVFLIFHTPDRFTPSHACCAKNCGSSLTHR